MSESETQQKQILVCGGAGFIGSHTVVQLYENGYTCVILDNFCNSSPECVKRLEAIVGQEIEVCEVDLLDKDAVRDVFDSHPNIEAVIHFAGLKAVGESVQKPLLYYKTNLTGTMNLLEVMADVNVKNIVFSSSATVYGTPQYLPLDEKHSLSTTNPYGTTKLWIEGILQDVYKADNEWQICILRYFNPTGAHKSGTIGEDPKGPPNNLMPYVSQVAVGKREVLSVFGDSYDTRDGTGVRDFIHVVDLAQAHVCALGRLEEKPGVCIYNLGTGTGYSVLEMVAAMEAASGKKIPYKIAPPRDGDVASCYANPALAKEELHWEAERGLEEMCADLWRWQSNNPNGFDTAEE